MKDKSTGGAFTYVLSADVVVDCMGSEVGRRKRLPHGASDGAAQRVVDQQDNHGANYGYQQTVNIQPGNAHRAELVEKPASHHRSEEHTSELQSLRHLV